MQVRGSISGQGRRRSAMRLLPFAPAADMARFDAGAIRGHRLALSTTHKIKGTGRGPVCVLQ